MWFHRRPSRCCFNSLFHRTGTGWFEISHLMKLVQTSTRTWWWCVSMSGARFAVFVRRARVLPSPCCATRNLSFLRCSPAPSQCCFNWLFHWTGTGWCENSTRWKSCKQLQTRGGGAWACLAQGLQCLCDERACCPALLKQLVICRSCGVTGARRVVVSTGCFTGVVRDGL